MVAHDRDVHWMHLDRGAVKRTEWLHSLDGWAFGSTLAETAAAAAAVVAMHSLDLVEDFVRRSEIEDDDCLSQKKNKMNQTIQDSS